MTSTEVATRTPMQETLAQVRSDQFKQQIADALPGNVTPERFVRVAITAIMQTPEIVATDRDSIFQSVIRCAQDGLLPDGREAALTTRNDKKKGRITVYMPMIGGYRKIAAKHGMILVADVVRANDAFTWSKLPPRLEHEPAVGERGDILYAYAAAYDRDWRFVAAPVVMDVPEIEKVRAVSHAATSEYGPWVNWYDRMCCKTVARRLFKELPLGDLDEQAARIIEAADADADLPKLNAATMTVDEANIAAPLAGVRVPQDDGPDDTLDHKPEPTLDDALVAGETTVPNGVHAGKSLAEVAALGRDGESWLLAALKRPQTDPSFGDALTLFVKTQLPAVWQQFVASRDAA